MFRIALTALSLIAFATCAARAGVTEQEAIQAQVASAMASADYAAKNCASLRIDQQRLMSQIKRSGITEAQLRASEDYADQRDVIREMEKNYRAEMLCAALPLAHGGYGRGIVVKR